MEQSNRVILLGHRGSPLKERENTLSSFATAIKDGADGVELDIHLTKDRELAVIHDFNTKRVFGQDRAVEECTISELKEISNGEIPTLKEVFDELGPLYYDIEVKANIRYDKGLLGLLTELLNSKRELAKNVAISSFNPLALRTFYSLNRDKYPLAVIYDGPPTTVPWFLQRGQGRFFCPCSFLKPKYDIAKRESKHGYALMPWAVDKKEELDEMLRLRLAGLITNDTESIVKFLQERGLR